MKALISTPTLSGNYGSLQDYLQRILCTAQVRVRPGGAGGALPTFDATTQSPFNAIASGGALTFSHTIAGGANFLEVSVFLSTATQWVTGINWDQAGTPQAMIRMGRAVNAANCAVEKWILFNPTTGTRQVAVTLSATGIGVAAAASYIGVGSFRSMRQATGSSTSASIVTESQDTLGLIVDAMIVKNASAATANQTQRYNTTEANGPTRDCSQTAVGTGGQITMTWTVTSGAWAILCYELRPTDDRTYQTSVDAGGYPANLPSTILAAGTDEVWVGYYDRFTTLRTYVQTALVGGQTIGVDYWTGAAWAAVSGLTDGSSNLTVLGESAISWADPGTAWSLRTLNSGPLMYYIRLRVSGTPSTAPVIRHLVVNWTIYDADPDIGTANSALRNIMRTIGEDGLTTTVFLDVMEGTASTQGSFRGGARLWEGWNPALHLGTNQCPLAAQAFSGLVLWNKSASPPAATLRNVTAYVSRDAVILCVFDGQTAGVARCMGVQKLVPYVVNDAWAWAIWGSSDANGQDNNGFVAIGLTTNPGNGAFLNGAEASAYQYVQRSYAGSGGSRGILTCPGVRVSATLTDFFIYTNTADGKLLQRPIEIADGGPGGGLRGTMAGVVSIPHTSAAALQNGDPYVDPNTGIKYTIVRVTNLHFNAVASAVISPWIALETPH